MNNDNQSGEAEKRKLVFISHSANHDAEKAKCFQDFFLKAYKGKVDVFVSTTDGIACGNSPQQTLEKNLISADVIVVLLTPAGIKSDWITFEVGFVAGHKGKIIPLLLKGLSLENVQKPIRDFFQIKDITKENALAEAIAEISLAVNDVCRADLSILKNNLNIEEKEAEKSHSGVALVPALGSRGRGRWIP